MPAIQRHHSPALFTVSPALSLSAAAALTRTAPLMSQTPVWKQTPAERAATFDAVFAQAQPAESKTPTARAQLRAMLSLIVKKRTQGYSINQIAELLKDPRIGIDVTPTYIRVILREAEAKRAKRRKARMMAIIAAADRRAATTAPRNTPMRPVAPFGTLPTVKP